MAKTNIQLTDVRNIIATVKNSVSKTAKAKKKQPSTLKNKIPNIPSRESIKNKISPVRKEQPILKMENIEEYKKEVLKEEIQTGRVRKGGYWGTIRNRDRRAALVPCNLAQSRVRLNAKNGFSLDEMPPHARNFSRE